MKHNRGSAFDEWWSQPENEAQRFTPSEIWDAACEWMKEEVQWRIEHCLEKADL